jgi:hypothetical protein
MMPGVRREDRVLWLACLAAGVLVLVGCALPTVEIGQDAFIGAGDAQRGFDYDRSLRFATYVEAGALVFVVGAAGLVLLAVIALAHGSTPVLVVAAAVVSFALVVQVVRVADELDWPEGGVYSCEKPRLEGCIPILTPAVRDLQTDIGRRPEAAEPGFELLAQKGYRARGKRGWSLIVWASAGAALVTAFGLFRLFLRPVWAAAAVTACAFVFLAVLFLRALRGLE